jgi:hypothetical protein
MTPAKQTSGNSLFDLLASLWALTVLGALGVWAYQSYVYLKTGAWVSLSVNDALFRMTRAPWFVSPDDWIGVHQVLGQINVGVAAILLALAITWLLLAINGD